jgi:threonine-phosphate decarboxylase
MRADKMRFEPRKEIADLPATVHGGQGWRYAGVEDYSQNLNPFGPPPELADAIVGAMSQMGHYPDASNAEPRRALAEAYGVPAECISMGAGSSEIIRDFPNVFCAKGDRVLLMHPSFAEYAQQCRIAGAEVSYMELEPENGFRIDEVALSARLREEPYKAVYICNPNNPTGVIEDRAKLERIISEASDLGTLVFLDETLLALSDPDGTRTMIPRIGRYDNLVIADSYTKSFAVPGLRIGFCISSPEIAEQMAKVQLPWNLGVAEQAAAVYLAGRLDYVRSAACELRRESERMERELSGIGFPCVHTDSFFRFAPVGTAARDGRGLQEKMLRHGIMIRDCASFGGRFAGYVRYCAKDSERDGRFIEAAEAVMKETEGL